jgi:uncharacterized protein YpbB
MVEVFKTDVRDPAQAGVLTEQIRKTFAGYEATFDLEDCDKILRVKSPAGVDTPVVIRVLNDLGCRAEVLLDEVKEIEIIKILEP